MTKVEVVFDLARPLDDALLARIADAHAEYGMSRVRPAPSKDKLVVEYDASRLTLADVQSALHRAGIPVYAGLRNTRQ